MENGTLERFLDGLSAFVHGRLVNVPDDYHEHATWRMFADMVAAVTGYE